MAKTLYSQSGKIEYGIKKYTVDTEADKEALNLRTTKMGSKCYVIDTKKWYILNSSNQWVPFVDAGGSGSGESSFIPKGSVATIDDLPTEDNAIGDLYIVQEDHSEWVWLTNSEYPEGYWEQIGNPESFIVQVEANTDNETYQADKTYSEIRQAYNTGKVIFVVLDEEDVYQLAAASDTEFSFTHCYTIFGQINRVAVNTLTVYSNNVWVMSKANITPAETVETVIGATPTITPEANTVYNCGELTSLTISNPPATGKYSIIFFSGATATTTVGIENFIAEANKRYKIEVENNYATYDSWDWEGV